MFIGHTSTSTELAALGLGNMLANFFFMIGIRGFNGALDTLISQAFGAGVKRECGIYLNRSRIIVTLFVIPMFTILYFGDRLLIWMGQDEAASIEAGIYLRYWLPGLYMVALYDTTRRFLLAMRKPLIPMVIQISTTILHFLWCYIFIIRMELGLAGSGLAMTTTYSLNFILVQAYAWTVPELEEYWAPFFSLESLKGFKKYLSLALPSYVMLSLPQWVIEICSFMAGYVSVTSMSAQATLFNCSVFFLQLPLGFMYASSTFVGNNVGKRQKKTAQFYGKLTFCIAIALEVCIVLFLNIFAKEITEFYTDDADAMPLIQEGLHFMAVNSFM